MQKIADMAHARGVDVMVDGAHAFAHFDYKIPDTAMPTTWGVASQVSLSAGAASYMRAQGQNWLVVADLWRLLAL